MKLIHISFVLLIGAISLILLSPNAFAVGSSGFENASLSSRSLARSNAVVADPEDASTVAFNPAGLTKLGGSELYSGATFITLSSEYDGAEGRSSEDASETMVPVPYTYVALKTPIDGFVIGAGMNSPFGFISKWSSTGSFRYTAYYNELKTAAYHISAGYEMFPWLSIGGGWTYMEVGLKQVGKFNTNFLVGVPPGTFADSPFEFDVEGEGNGWNLGMFITPNEEHSIGLFYRSQLHTELKGRLTSNDLGPLSGVFGGSTSTTSADTDITFPHNLTIGYRYRPSEKLDLEIDLGWTGWSSFDRQQVAFGTSNAVLTGFERTNRDFHDVFSLNSGLSYRLDEHVSLSGGYYFYSMAANLNNYDNAIPDGPRHGWTIGLIYEESDWSFELVYLLSLVDEVNVENTVGIANGTDIDGDYSGIIHSISTGFKYRF